MFLACVPLKMLGQDFKWAYNPTPSATQTLQDFPQTAVVDLVTGSNNEIYSIMEVYGAHEFGDGRQLNLGNNKAALVIVKLDEDKNVLWVKHLNYNGEYVPRAITLDDNGNVLIAGHARPNASLLYLDPNPADPGSPENFEPTHENLTFYGRYGFVLKLDAQGTYMNAVVFEEFKLFDIVKDNNNDLVAVGGEYDSFGRSYAVKLDNSLNIIWEKIIESLDGEGESSFFEVACDSQGNAYITGGYSKSFTFGGHELQDNDNELGFQDRFICKLSATGTEEWIVETPNQNVSPIRIDASDNLYFFSDYNEPSAIQFTNTMFANFPLVENSEMMLFKIDANANLIWNVPVYGSGPQNFGSFTINTLGELIITIRSTRHTEFNYATPATTIDTGNSINVLLKVNSSGALVDFKRLYEKAADYGLLSLAIHTDADDNIILGGFFKGTIDFDPDFNKEYKITTPIYTFTDNNGTYTDYEHVAFIVKLAACDVDPLFDSTYDFCLVENPNPTIANIKPSLLNVKWYASPASPTPLAPSAALTNGQTYYYENIVQNCFNLGRVPIQIRILPPDVPPIIEALQPCYFQGMKLSDINISGQNLAFYFDLTSTDSIASSTVIVPDVIYYVTQRTAKCESNRIPLSVKDYFGSMPTERAISFCDDNISRKIDLSDYNHLFIAANTSESDYTFSYHKSANDASANIAPITIYQNYPVAAETVYVRMSLQLQSCFRVAALTMELFTPPVVDEVKIEDLVNSNSITILPYDPNYLYSLDGIAFQESNYFGDLSAGEYNVQIRIADCPGIPKKVMVLEYPKFFTPNGDGTNDTWKVKYSQLQFSFDIEIYDRYGRIVASLNKSTAGWDGKYKGFALPSADYWFRIIRVSNKETVYTGHFSMKR